MGEAPSFRSTRNRQPMVDTVAWVKNAARGPCDVASGVSSPDGIASNDLFVQALQFREVLYSKQFSHSRIDESVSQKRQKLGPSLYEEEETSPQITRTLRSSERILSLRKKPPSPDSSPASLGSDAEQEPAEANHTSSKCRRSQIRVGPKFQANCPEWRARLPKNSSDAIAEKFQGERLWPLGKPTRRYTNCRRWQTQCCCARPGSMDCARWHIKEKRHQLRLELGPAFSSLGFDQMGEVVALSWSSAEEEKFMAAARLTQPTLDRVFPFIPSKTRREVVSYYFNVFILRLRGYQNRVTMAEASSDDEDADPMQMICVQNAQLLDVDDCSGHQ
ncbi:AT-rich interactive domain-containing protein 1-like [Wolffia australiana]